MPDRRFSDLTHRLSTGEGKKVCVAKPGEERRPSGLPFTGDHHLAIFVREAFQILSRGQHEPALAGSTPPAHSFPFGRHLPKTGKAAEHLLGLTMNFSSDSHTFAGEPRKMCDF